MIPDEQRQLEIVNWIRNDCVTVYRKHQHAFVSQFVSNVVFHVQTQEELYKISPALMRMLIPFKVKGYISPEECGTARVLCNKAYLEAKETYRFCLPNDVIGEQKRITMMTNPIYRFLTSDVFVRHKDSKMPFKTFTLLFKRWTHDNEIEKNYSKWSSDWLMTIFEQLGIKVVEECIQHEGRLYHTFLQGISTCYVSSDLFF